MDGDYVSKTAYWSVQLMSAASIDATLMWAIDYL